MNGTFEKPSTQQIRGTVYVLYYENKLRSNLMPVKYQNVWRTLNDLESVTSKVSSANEILNCALDSLENHKYDKVENLIYATQEFLEYYLRGLKGVFSCLNFNLRFRINQKHLLSHPIRYYLLV